jgi:hypothetical protein
MDRRMGSYLGKERRVGVENMEGTMETAEVVKAHALNVCEPYTVSYRLYVVTN